MFNYYFQGKILRKLQSFPVDSVHTEKSIPFKLGKNISVQKSYKAPLNFMKIVLKNFDFSAALWVVF